MIQPFSNGWKIFHSYLLILHLLSQLNNNSSNSSIYNNKTSLILKTLLKYPRLHPINNNHNLVLITKIIYTDQATLRAI